MGDDAADEGADEAESQRGEALERTSAEHGKEAGTRSHEQAHDGPGDEFVGRTVHETPLVDSAPDLIDLVDSSSTGLLDAGLRLVGRRSDALADRRGGFLGIAGAAEEKETPNTC